MNFEFGRNSLFFWKEILEGMVTLLPIALQSPVKKLNIHIAVWRVFDKKKLINLGTYWTVLEISLKVIFFFI